MPQPPQSNNGHPSNGNGHINGYANGHANGHAASGAGLQGQTSTLVKTAPRQQVTLPKDTLELPIEQPIILERHRFWSHALVWTIVGVTTAGVLWAAFAPIEQAVPATGRLEPDGAVHSVEPPSPGVVTAIHVRDGDHVKKGDLLLSLDPRTTEADVQSYAALQKQLVADEKRFASRLNGGVLDPNNPNVADLASLVNLRNTLIVENQFLEARLTGGSPAGGPNPQINAVQQELLRSSRAEIEARIAAQERNIQEQKKQYEQVSNQLVTAQQVVDLNQKILSQIEPLVAEGALSQLQYSRQMQEVLTRRSEVERLTGEKQRLEMAIAQAEKELATTIATNQRTILDRIAENQRRIADIDVQIGRTRQQDYRSLVDNQKRLVETNSQLAKAEVANAYRELRAPADGTVFDLQVTAVGQVVSPLNPGSKPVLKIVPDDNLVATVYLTNRDIGFVEPGMPVEVQVASFPSSEFGVLHGTLVAIGSDALPPTQERPFYAFPARIELDEQEFRLKNGNTIRLQSGMEVNAQIKVRKRTVLSIFTERFNNRMDSLKTVR